jgi:threonylcarbamoyladenosine tRNA methylthiotransferase MtaB
VKTASFHTFGCRINQYETEAIREEVLALGYREVDPAEPADVHVVNTCAVTAESGAKARRHVGRLARLQPDARIVVVGCSTRDEKERLARIPQVVFLAGNEEKEMVASFLNGGWKPGDPFPSREPDIFRLEISRYADRTRANVKVQDGCDAFCSFCIIPFLRGRSRSRHPDAVVEEIRRLAANGYQEVVLTGVHLQDYGRDLDPPVELADLLRRAAAASTGIRRIRLSSISPRAFTGALLEVLGDPVFCPQWHVPLQSGSDEVLKRMRRDYRLDDFRRVAAALRARHEEPAITTDIIAGHPGETDADFEATLAAAAEFRFAKIHVFPYSAREGTLASRLGGRVDPLEVGRRALVLRRLEEKLALAYKRRFLGRTVEVLVESRHGEEDAAVPAAVGPDAGDLEGTTERYLKVRFPPPSPRARERFPGTFQRVRVTAVESALARGEWVEEA